MKRFLLLFVFVMAILALPKLAFADEPNLVRDFSQASPNGEYLFVLLANETRDSYNEAGSVLVDENLRQTYAQSGLYRNDGSNTPLWTVDWNANEVVVASDGRHLVRWGPFPASGQFDEIALEFYRDGQLLKSYQVKDLVKDPNKLPQTVSHYLWLKTSSYDDATGQLSLETEMGEQYSFDITNGAIAGAPVSISTANLVYLGLAAIAVVALSAFMINKR
jgi:hypothetical protein